MFLVDDFYSTIGLNLGTLSIDILIIATPIIPLNMKRSIAETPCEDMATRIITVERTKPVFLAKLPKSV